jgi:hypothetical protein
MDLQEKYVGDVDRQSHAENSVFYSAFHGPVSIGILIKWLFSWGIDNNAILCLNKILTFSGRYQ